MLQSIAPCPFPSLGYPRPWRGGREIRVQKGEFLPRGAQLCAQLQLLGCEVPGVSREDMLSQLALSKAKS